MPKMVKGIAKPPKAVVGSPSQRGVLNKHSVLPQGPSLKTANARASKAAVLSRQSSPQYSPPYNPTSPTPESQSGVAIPPKTLVGNHMAKTAVTRVVQAELRSPQYSPMSPDPTPPSPDPFPVHMNPRPGQQDFTEEKRQWRVLRQSMGLHRWNAMIRKMESGKDEVLDYSNDPPEYKSGGSITSLRTHSDEFFGKRRKLGGLTLGSMQSGWAPNRKSRYRPYKAATIARVSKWAQRNNDNAAALAIGSPSKVRDYEYYNACHYAKNLTPYFNGTIPDYSPGPTESSDTRRLREKYDTDVSNAGTRNWTELGLPNYEIPDLVSKKRRHEDWNDKSKEDKWSQRIMEQYGHDFFYGLPEDRESWPQDCAASTNDGSEQGSGVAYPLVDYPLDINSPGLLVSIKARRRLMEAQNGSQYDPGARKFGDLNGQPVGLGLSLAHFEQCRAEDQYGSQYEFGWSSDGEPSGEESLANFEQHRDAEQIGSQYDPGARSIGDLNGQGLGSQYDPGARSIEDSNGQGLPIGLGLSPANSEQRRDAERTPTLEAHSLPSQIVDKSPELPDYEFYEPQEGLPTSSPFSISGPFDDTPKTGQYQTLESAARESVEPVVHEPVLHQPGPDDTSPEWAMFREHIFDHMVAAKRTSNPAAPKVDLASYALEDAAVNLRKLLAEVERKKWAALQHERRAADSHQEHLRREDLTVRKWWAGV